MVILNELVHDARIVPVDGRPHLPAHLRQWKGDSRGRWEGDTLVVDTINFRRDTSLRKSTANTHLTERFRLVDADTLLYEFTVNDPTTWTRPWTTTVRVRVPRGQLRDVQHLERRARRRESRCAEMKGGSDAT